jgi:release factor-specific protein-(glutamine-N5) methyltransferase
MNYDRPLDADELSTLHDGVVRRGKGEPLQYVTGEMPFRHIVLRCAPGVLIPRPETEVLVDCVLAYLDGLPEQGSDASPRRVLEVGVGTGCISLSVAGERSGVEVVATDVSPEAVALACRNRDALGLDGRVDVRLADLTDGVPGADEGAYDVLVSNPPYIPSELVELLPAEVGGYEPRLALDGGPDGLDVFRRLTERAARALRPGGLYACELHEDCLEAAAAEPAVTQAFCNACIVRDLAGRNRILMAQRRPVGERSVPEAPAVLDATAVTGFLFA